MNGKKEVGIHLEDEGMGDGWDATICRVLFFVVFKVLNEPKTFEKGSEAFRWKLN